MFFFFQAEDGIRDYKVTGVQTCALPILARRFVPEGEIHHFVRNDKSRAADDNVGASSAARIVSWRSSCSANAKTPFSRASRSEERRVGKECGMRGWVRA